MEVRTKPHCLHFEGHRPLRVQEVFVISVVGDAESSWEHNPIADLLSTSELVPDIVESSPGLSDARGVVREYGH